MPRFLAGPGRGKLAVSIRCQTPGAAGDMARIRAVPGCRKNPIAGRRQRWMVVGAPAWHPIWEMQLPGLPWYNHCGHRVSLIPHPGALLKGPVRHFGQCPDHVLVREADGIRNGRSRGCPEHFAVVFGGVEVPTDGLAAVVQVAIERLFTFQLTINPECMPRRVGRVGPSRTGYGRNRHP